MEFAVQRTGRRLVAGTKAVDGAEINLEKAGVRFWACPASAPGLTLKQEATFPSFEKNVTEAERTLGEGERVIWGNSGITLRSGYYVTHCAHEA